jgi:hypothetical protein
MKDDRLYARLVLDFADHPKIQPLSDAAFRCLIEATLWSRKHMTDGFLSRRLALARWLPEVLLELASNDLHNPSLIEADEGWYIHDFAAHQSTKAEIEALREARKSAGQRGGLAKQASAKASAKASAVAKLKPPVSVSVSDSVGLEPSFKKEGTRFSVEINGTKVAVAPEVRELVHDVLPTAVLRARATRDGLYGHSQQLADDGATENELRATLAEWCNRTDAFPGHLPRIYTELARKAAGGMTTAQAQQSANPSTTDQRVTQTLRLAEKYAEQETRKELA